MSTATIAGKSSQAATAAQGSRRVSVGTVPDFAFGGPGVKVGSVVPGSAAEAAGLQAGDVLVAIDDEKVDDLKMYSDLLKQLEPGQTVTLTIQRGGDALKKTVTVTER